MAFFALFMCPGNHWIAMWVLSCWGLTVGMGQPETLCERSGSLKWGGDGLSLNGVLRLGFMGGQAIPSRAGKRVFRLPVLFW